MFGFFYKLGRALYLPVIFLISPVLFAESRLDISDRVVSAALAVDRGNYTEAASLYQRIALSFPQDCIRKAFFLSLTGDAFHRAGSFNSAALAYADAAAVTNSPTDSICKNLFMAADSYERGGNILLADEFYGRIITSASNITQRTNAALRLGAMYERANLPDKAVLAYEQVASFGTNGLSPLQYQQSRIALARTYQRKKNFTESIKILEMLPDLDEPLSSEAEYIRIVSLAALSSPDTAITNAEEYIACHSSSVPTNFPKYLPEICFWNATAVYNNGDFERAEVLFKSFRDKFPGHELAPQSLFYAAVSAFRQKSFTDTSALVVSLISSYPSSLLVDDAKFLQAKALAALARFEDVVLVSDDLIVRYPDSEYVIPVTILRGDALSALSGSKNYSKEAVLSYAAALNHRQISPDLSIYCLTRMAKVLRRSGDESGARAAIQKIAEMNKNKRRQVFGENDEH